MERDSLRCEAEKALWWAIGSAELSSPWVPTGKRSRSLGEHALAKESLGQS